VKSTFSKQEANTRIASCVLQLGEYDLTIVHKSNQQIQNVDALSQNPQVSEQTIYVAMITAEDWLFAAQQSDRSITAIRKILESGDRKGNKSIFNDYNLKSGRVYRITPFELRWMELLAVRIFHPHGGPFTTQSGAHSCPGLRNGGRGFCKRRPS
jgi:hypothetical protein